MSQTVGLGVRGAESVFPKEEYDARIAAARKRLAALGIDALVLTGPENIYYLTGQQTPGYYTFQCLILPTEEEPLFLLRQLELINFLRNTFISRYEVYQDNGKPAEIVVAALERMELKGKHIAIEKRGWFLPIEFYELLTERLGGVAEGSGIVEPLRMVKSPLEIKMLEEAARITDAGMRAGLAAIRPGATENDLVAAMMGAAIQAGSEYMGMEPLVSSGPRSGVPHATWRRRQLAAGDPVFLEMAGCYNRYHAGLLRTAWLGKPPKQALEMVKIAEEALQAALAVMRPGVSCEVVHNAAQAVIDRYGMTERYRKRTGYSTGISFAPDWGEWMVLSLFTGIKEPLQPGMAFHLPVALREYEVFTVGASETAVVTETGCRTLGTIKRGLWEI
ncbi:MAG TPA: Xaa-Pro peptidase family protein [Alphaproteobacteria bacterium]|nr:Xaa-Pro peptidase family protein [Alphaproteobacteria bacterium]